MRVIVFAATAFVALASCAPGTSGPTPATGTAAIAQAGQEKLPDYRLSFADGSQKLFSRASRVFMSRRSRKYVVVEGHKYSEASIASHVTRLEEKLPGKAFQTVATATGGSLGLADTTCLITDSSTRHVESTRTTQCVDVYGLPLCVDCSGPAGPGGFIECLVNGGCSSDPGFGAAVFRQSGPDFGCNFDFGTGDVTCDWEANTGDGGFNPPWDNNLYAYRWFFISQYHELECNKTALPGFRTGFYEDSNGKILQFPRPQPSGQRTIDQQAAKIDKPTRFRMVYVDVVPLGAPYGYCEGTS